jgi:serine/threonine protein kinase
MPAGAQSDVAASGQPREIKRLGPYLIVARIGSGGMGEVYKAYDESLERFVAIKVLPPELARQEDFVRRFRAEATAVAKLAHPNIVPIHAVGKDAGNHFFVMQYVQGASLAQLLAEHKRLSVDETLTIVEQALAGLAAAHKRGLIHRDIKPGNILLDQEHHRALVADFGLVKTIASGQSDTATGVIMGTVDYLSPEQARSQNVDARSDLYSLGVMMYQMLAGRLPFDSDTATGMIFQHAYEQPPPLTTVAPDVPQRVAAMVARLMAKDAGHRYQTAEQVMADISEVRAGKPPSAAEPISASGGTSAVIAAPVEEPLTAVLLPVVGDRLAKPPHSGFNRGKRLRNDLNFLG